MLSWGLFVVLNHFISSEPINYFIVAGIVSFYSEIMARILKTPAAPVVTTSLIPLIPGGSLYYTMASAFESDFTTFLEKAVYTLKLASALALGIIVITAISQLLFRCVKQK
ncbi:MAG: threonine/serine exporter family protein [Oscillospiraceae bacterium]|nr:threonine/serine exporter family protein [Oscillospiraceae bacterium]